MYIAIALLILKILGLLDLSWLSTGLIAAGLASIDWNTVRAQSDANYAIRRTAEREEKVTELEVSITELEDDVAQLKDEIE